MGKTSSNIPAQQPSSPTPAGEGFKILDEVNSGTVRTEGLQDAHALPMRAEKPRQIEDVQTRAISQGSRPWENSNTMDDAKILMEPSNKGLVLGALKELAKTINERMARMEQKLDAVLPPKLPEGMISTKVAMGVLGYKDIASFLAAARQRRVFHTRINARKFCWSPAAIEEWKKERGVGKPPSASSLSNSGQFRRIL